LRLLSFVFYCAQNRTRTCTSLLTLVPETSASTNFAIWALIRRKGTKVQRHNGKSLINKTTMNFSGNTVRPLSLYAVKPYLNWAFLLKNMPINKSAGAKIKKNTN
jgi:hypothetical protein